MIRFEKITEENFDTAVDITVTEEQDHARHFGTVFDFE